MKIKEFTAGETAFILESVRRKTAKYDVSPARILKVGRKYVTVETTGSWEMQFEEWDRRSGELPYLVEHTEYGDRRRLFKTERAAMEQIETEELRTWISAATEHNKLRGYTLEQLRKVKEILKGD